MYVFNKKYTESMDIKGITTLGWSLHGG